MPTLPNQLPKQRNRNLGELPHARAPNRPMWVSLELVNTTLNAKTFVALPVHKSRQIGMRVARKIVILESVEMGSRTVHAVLPEPGKPGWDPAFSNELKNRILSANGVRNGVYKALSKVPVKERVPLYKRLIRELENAGINVSNRLFILGIPATSPEELSPNDLGKLIRSVYLNEPETMDPISATLTEILGPNSENMLVQPTSSRQRKRR